MQQALYNLRQLFVKKKITPVVFTLCIVCVKHPKNDTWKSILPFSFTDPSLNISLVIKKNGIQVRLVISALNVHRRNSQLQWKLQQFHVLELVVSKLVNNVIVNMSKYSALQCYTPLNYTWPIGPICHFENHWIFKYSRYGRLSAWIYFDLYR